MDESAMTLACLTGAIDNYTQTPKNGVSVSDFDVEEFLHHFDEFDMTEEEKHEVLHALWEIMCRFVEIGFGLDSHTLALNAGAACESFEETPASDSANLL